MLLLDVGCTVKAQVYSDHKWKHRDQSHQLHKDMLGPKIVF